MEAQTGKLSVRRRSGKIGLGRWTSNAPGYVRNRPMPSLSRTGPRYSLVHHTTLEIKNTEPMLVIAKITTIIVAIGVE